MDCSDSSGLRSGAAAAPAPPQGAFNLLLVSGNRRWTQAVRNAAADIGGGLSLCDAKGAVIRLACIAPRYSHLLLHLGSADGLLNELVDLTVGDRDSSTELLLLGTNRPPPRIGAIRTADRDSVRRALAPNVSPAHAPRMDPMHLTELRDALAGAMIETRYQPIVRLADRRPVALEALARLNHPTRGTLPPGEFVPQIEDAGLAALLTDVVVDRALADVAGPLLQPLGLDITLNFPLDVLLVPDALRRLDASRRAAGVAAERVVIELTESREVRDPVMLGGVLQKLRSDGYRISIDDIAPTVPHVDDLLDLPFTTLKLDKAVVLHHEEPVVQDFVRQVMKVARKRGLAVVAEGVEDVATWRAMRALGIDHAQGFLVARPLPAAAVPIWLEAWRSQPEFG